MYLSRLELYGFKSFAKKTKIDFHDGMTAIVGPNGCGKSNVVDAIRWVLGEQKAGTLRSENMQNVIFNGTRTQKPLGMSEVSLTILNNKHVLPIEYSEVVLTRRLFRSGESQYLLNNSVCRLKDITDLFMDTGMGANAYSVIELSMVEKILNGKPEERRQIFEEAAGVTKYKLRRRAAYRKLEATEGDLFRVSDIISEVEKTVNSLRRQVNKARRYRDMSEELRTIELDFSAHHLQLIHNELSPLENEVRELTDERAKVTAGLAEQEAAIEQSQTKVLEIERELSQQHGKLDVSTRKIQEKEEEILISRERVAAAKKAKERAKEDSTSLQQRSETIAAEQEEITAAIAGMEGDLEKAREALDAERQALETLRQAYAGKRQESGRFEAARLNQIENIGEKRKEEERLKTQLEYSERQLQQLTAEKADLGKRKSTAEEKAKELAEQKKALDESHADVMEQQAVVQRDLDAARDSLEAEKDAQLKLQGKLNNRRDRAEMLRKFLESYEDYPEGVRFLLQEDGGVADCHGALSEVISVEDRHRRAIEAALGDAAVALVVSKASSAIEAIGTLRRSGKGSVTFMPAEGFGDANGHLANRPDVLGQPGVIGWADGLVQAPNEAANVIPGVLGHILVVENLDAALHYGRLFGGQRLSVVTLDGELVHGWGAIRGGESPDAEATLVGRKAVIEKLEAEIQQLEEDLAKSEQRLTDGTERIAALEASDAQLQEQKAQQLTLLQEVEIALAQSRTESDRLSQRLLNIDEELHNIQVEAGVVDETLKNLLPSVADIERQRSETDASYAVYQKDVAGAEEELRAKESEVQTLHIANVTRETEYRALQQTLDRLGNDARSVAQSITRRHEEAEAAGKEIDELTKRIETLREQLEKDFGERKGLEEALAEVETRHRASREQIDEKEKAIKQVRVRRDTVSEDLHKKELRLSELRLNAQNIREQMREAYELDISTHPAPDEIDLPVVSERINVLKQKLRTMGPVNMLALKDYEVEKERLDFLQAQKDDLLRAEENLKETIKVINDTAQERFFGVFAQIREHFIEVFRSFFENGLADLRLGDDDPLEAEIVIEASPKGKKLGSLALLSGGEKTLTAISLLFALYLVKPSPFCILDEVDAPLDDANIGRFSSALDKFADRTQFIVVTHNKLTMNAAAQLYGITMEEPGVSKVVSVKFEDSENNNKSAAEEKPRSRKKAAN